MTDKSNIIVIGLHDKKKALVEVEEVGKCLLCRKPVFLATMGVSGELEITDLRALKLRRFLGMPCVLEIVEAFGKIMETPIPEREKLVQNLIKKERENRAN